MIILLPILLLAGGVGVLAYIAASDTPPVHEPDLPPVPGSTRYKRVDAILDQLKQAAAASGIPLGLLIGWIAKESGGKLEEVTSLDERGYFQLMPDESKALGLDHKRLSTDSVYSINAGLLLIGRYMKEADALGIFPKGSSAYWRLVKLGHTVGSGDTRKLASSAQAAGQTGSWDAFEQYALSGAASTKHSPKKWFPFIADIYAVGRPFGFGNDGPTVAGADSSAFTDIPDVLEMLPKYRKRG